MKFKNTRIFNFEGALRGMRNPKESWAKSDSRFGLDSIEGFNVAQKEFIAACDLPQDEKTSEYFKNNGIIYQDFDILEYALIGPEDMKLAKKLIISGPEHRKFMRQIFVYVDITAPLYWWKEFDTYKVGTVANSTSTMHKLATTSITLDCFDTDDYDARLVYHVNDSGDSPIDDTIGDISEGLIEDLEILRKKYLETRDKKYWKELIRWLPESWLQTRTITLNYENLLAMCSKGQRRFHKLNEWSGKDNSTLSNFISWARTLPYAQELIFIDELEKSVDE